MRQLYLFLQCLRIFLHLFSKAAKALVWLIKECFLWIGQIVATIWIGIPTGVKRIAEKWTKDATEHGFDSRYSDYLYCVFWVVALLSTLAGWIAYSYLTVFLVNWILHW